MTDRYITQLWRKAVLKKYNNSCVLCGKSGSLVECHHFIKRRIVILRYDWRNGFPLCKYTCHKRCHTMAGVNQLIKFMGEERFNYLCEMEKWTIKNYLFAHEISRNEWELEIVKELKEIIQSETFEDQYEI